MGSPDHNGNPDLVAELGSLLSAEGSITFARFMELALHHPQHGYYAKPEPVVGTDGDFLTAPALHPAFGRTLWQQIKQMLQLAERSTTGLIMEVGAGAGQMARDILLAARADRAQGTVRYLIREQSDRLRQRQQETIAAAWPEAPVNWVDRMPEVAAKIDVIVMNELMSALPVHRLVFEDGRWRELYVRRSSTGRLEMQPGPVSEPRAVAALGASAIRPKIGQIFDVNVAAADMLTDLVTCLGDRAFILNIDYGGPAQVVYRSSRPQGSVRCYYRQAIVNNPFSRIGRQDITADVDFDLLSRAGEQLGLHTYGPIPQGAFLLNLGIEAVAVDLAANIARGEDATAADQELQKVYALYAPEALGESFWVMVHAKGFPNPPDLQGFQTPPWPRSYAELVLGGAR